MYSDLTLSDSSIIVKYQPDINKPKPSFGVNILTTKCYSVCTGVVLQILRNSKNTYTVSIQYDANLLLRYGNLLTADVNLGDLIHLQQLVGLCNTYVTFEVCTKQISKVPVVVDNVVYYKQDPMPILTGEMKLENAAYIKKTYTVNPNIQTIF